MADDTDGEELNKKLTIPEALALQANLAADYDLSGLSFINSDKPMIIAIETLLSKIRDLNEIVTKQEERIKAL